MPTMLMVPMMPMMLMMLCDEDEDEYDEVDDENGTRWQRELGDAQRLARQWVGLPSQPSRGELVVPAVSRLKLGRAAARSAKPRQDAEPITAASSPCT